MNSDNLVDDVGLVRFIEYLSQIVFHLAGRCSVFAALILLKTFEFETFFGLRFGGLIAYLTEILFPVQDG